MNGQPTKLTLCRLVSISLLALAQLAFAQTIAKAQGTKKLPRPREMADRLKGQMEGPAAKDEEPRAKTEKSKPAAKFYRFKGEKKGTAGKIQPLILILEDMHTGKSGNYFVATEDSAGVEAPLSAVVEAIKGVEAGTPVEVHIEKRKGRPVVVSLAKAELVAGEEQPGVYVLVDWDKKEPREGKPVMAVKLRKLGREITAAVPLKKDSNSNEWIPAPPNAEYALGRVQRGGAIEAFLKPGNPPVVQDLFVYRPPERGKFIKFTQRETVDATHAAFEMLGNDGTTLTITLPGVAKTMGAKKVMMPDPRQLKAVQKIKPDTEIEVIFQPDNGTSYVLRDLRVISTPAKTTEAKKS